MSDNPTPPSNILKEHLQLKSKELQTEFETAEGFHHDQEIGFMREKLIHKVFSDFLPGVYELTHGKVIDCLENESRQVDLAIYDSRYPKLSYTDPDQLICEGVLSAIEIKSNLHNEMDDIGDFQENINNLDRYPNVEVKAHQSSEPSLDFENMKNKPAPGFYFAYTYKNDLKKKTKFESFLNRFNNRYGASKTLELDTNSRTVDIKTKTTDLPRAVCVLNEFCGIRHGSGMRFYNVKENSLQLFISTIMTEISYERERATGMITHYTSGIR